MRFRSRAGMTLVELIATMIVGSLVLFLGYDLFRKVHHHFVHGTVNLQNLHEARMAMCQIRRDFTSACPYFDGNPKDFEDFLLKFETIRRQLFNSQYSEPALQKNLINVTDRVLEFYRFDMESALVDANAGSRSGGGGVPLVQKVRYEYFPVKRTLERWINERHLTRVYRGVSSARFRLYVHADQKKVPLLHVTLSVHQGDQPDPRSTDIGNALPQTTSVSSAFLTSSIRNLDWNFEVFYKMKP